MFPGGAIRGQLFSGGNVNLAAGDARPARPSITNIENVTGGAGNDSLVGNSAVNTINGGAGADWIVGGPGNDTLNGGAGADVLVWSNGDGTDIDEGGADAIPSRSTAAPRRADVFTVAANGTRLASTAPTSACSVSTSAPSETLIVNGIGGADSFTVNDLTGVASLATLNLNGFDGDDTFISASVRLPRSRSTPDGGPGTDTLDYSASTTAVRANLGLGTTGLTATLGADQENPPTTHAGTGTATVTNYNIVTHTFDIAVTVTGLPPADVTGFHIHQGRGRRERADHRRFHRGWPRSSPPGPASRSPRPA